MNGTETETGVRTAIRAIDAFGVTTLEAMEAFKVLRGKMHAMCRCDLLIQPDVSTISPIIDTNRSLGTLEDLT